VAAAQDGAGLVRRYEASFLVRARRADGDDDPSRHPAPVAVGSASVCLVKTFSRQALQELDGLSADLSAAARALWECGRGLDWLCTDRTGLLVVECVEVQPLWRGRRIGLVGTALLLDCLRPVASGALLFPVQPGSCGDARAASSAMLTAYWARLGFRPWAQGHLSLSLRDGTVDRALEDLGRWEDVAACSDACRQPGRVASGSQCHGDRSTPPTPNHGSSVTMIH
jgi:hypothetical protein